MNRIVVVFLFFLAGTYCLAEQIQPPEIIVDTITEQAILPVEIISSNDFFGNPHQLTAQTPGPLPIEQSTGNEWIIWVIITSLASLAIARYLFPSRMQQFFKATLGMRFFNQMERDGSFFNETLTYLLFFNFAVVMALLITQTFLLFADSITGALTWHPGFIFLLALGAIILFYSLKGIITGAIAWVFKTQVINSYYLKNIYLFNLITGIILLPVVVYSMINASATGVFIAWILLFSAAVIKIGRNVMSGLQQAGFSVYYIILYLCAIELAPVLVLIKAVSRYLPNG